MGIYREKTAPVCRWATAMTHAELVKRAARWLRTTKGCGVVLTEHSTGEEFPDAIGWHVAMSILVECKVSRADFFADQKKPSRLRGKAERPAWQCWYLTPPGLLKPEDVPPWWGLLEARDRLVRVVKPPDIETAWDDRAECVLRHEVRRLYQEVRRYQAQGLKPLTYASADRQRRERLLFSQASNGTPSCDAVGQPATDASGVATRVEESSSISDHSAPSAPAGAAKEKETN